MKTLKKAILLIMLLINTALAKEGQFYVKPIFNSFYPEKIIGMTAKKTIVPGFAIGYNVTDNFRIDASIEHFSNIKHIVILKTQCYINRDDESSGVEICSYTKITTAELNLYVDLLKVKNSSLYIGIGAGLSRTKGNMTVGDEEIKIETTNDIAYSTYVGVSNKMLDNVDLEFGYSYKHLTENIHNYKGHSIFTAVRIGL